MNQRITVLFDREHIIGHSYLLPLKDDPSLENLADIFENKIMPFLQEYFYDDYQKIQLVLGDNQKDDDSVCFVVGGIALRLLPAAIVFFLPYAYIWYISNWEIPRYGDGVLRQ